jgi:hypothetical protein
MSGAALTQAERIARLNDLARRAMGIACVVVATEGIRAMPEADQSRLRELVETFDAFMPDNDPSGGSAQHLHVMARGDVVSWRRIRGWAGDFSLLPKPQTFLDSGARLCRDVRSDWSHAWPDRNFINGELWGRPTTLPWGIVFPDGGPLPRHPSQLYEAALEGPLLFVILWALYRFSGANRRPGVLTGCFVLGYGVLRFLVEFVREPDQQLLAFVQATGLHMGQWLCVPMIIGGGALIARGFNRPELRPIQLAP